MEGRQHAEESLSEAELRTMAHAIFETLQRRSEAPMDEVSLVAGFVRGFL